MTQDEAQNLEAARWELGLKILETAQSCAEGYRRSMSQFNTASENSESEKCAIAAANTGWFILESLGFSADYIKRLKAASERNA